MHRGVESRGGMWWAPLALVVSLLLVAGCGDDTYSECSVDQDSRCASEDDSVSCVEDDNTQCDSQICARYNGSDAFCTVSCTSDDDCMDGECVRIELGDSGKYCVEEQQED